MHLLTNISRNQVMKSGLLVEYNMRNIFLEELYAKCGGKISSRYFSEKSKSSLFLLYAKLRTNVSCKPFTFTSYVELFWKTKRGLELVSLPHFLDDFWRKFLLLLCSVESAKLRGCVGSWVAWVTWVTWVAWVYRILAWVAWVHEIVLLKLLLKISQNLQEKYLCWSL